MIKVEKLINRIMYYLFLYCSKMKLRYNIIYTDDVIKKVEFYENVFGFKIKFVHESNKYAELETGEVTLSIASYEFAPITIEKTTSNVMLSFETDSINIDYSVAITNGAIVVKPPEKKPWGQTVAYVKDLDGVLIELATKIDKR